MGRCAGCSTFLSDRSERASEEALPVDAGTLAGRFCARCLLWLRQYLLFALQRCAQPGQGLWARCCCCASATLTRRGLLTFQNLSAVSIVFFPFPFLFFLLITGCSSTTSNNDGLTHLFPTSPASRALYTAPHQRNKSSTNYEFRSYLHLARDNVASTLPFHTPVPHQIPFSTAEPALRRHLTWKKLERALWRLWSCGRWK
ncbi:hypothetical protein IWX49DRAFT_83493 [Phyllosticta citricarpa]|uniref:Uncharacterized protein n=2 Tax=Phyllosticta TaxID=121621 RepID=A0ABR1MPZ7_9PEZI